MTVHADAEAGLIPARVWEKVVPTADDRALMRTAVRRSLVVSRWR